MVPRFLLSENVTLDLCAAMFNLRTYIFLCNDESTYVGVRFLCVPDNVTIQISYVNARFYLCDAEFTEF